MIGIDELRRMLQDPPSEDDAYIVNLEESAVAYVERRTGKYFGATRVRTVHLRGLGTGTLYLAGPVVSVIGVTERPYPGGDDTALVEAEEDGWIVRDDQLLRRSGNAWVRGYEYEVEYEQGYEDADYANGAPTDIRQAVQQLVALWYEVRLPVALGTVAPPVPHGVGDILAAHTAPRV